MRAAKFILIASIVFAILGADATAAESAGTSGLELWLVSGSECNSCEIFAEVSERPGYATEIRYRNGDDIVIVPIKRIDGRSLSEL